MVSWIQKGTHIVSDKNGKLKTLIHAAAHTERSTQSQPSYGDYKNLIGNFFFHVVWTMKKALRGELLTAKNCCDVYMKDLLLQMAMWHKRLQTSEEFPFYGSRYFEKWADSWIHQGLKSAYAHYDREDITGSLDSTARLFSRIAQETGELLKYEYPAQYEKYSRQLVKSYLGKSGWE